MQVFNRFHKRGPAQKEMPAGILTVPCSTIQSMTRTYSAKPPPEGFEPQRCIRPSCRVGHWREGLVIAVVTLAGRGCGGTPSLGPPAANLADVSSYGGDYAGGFHVRRCAVRNGSRSQFFFKSVPQTPHVCTRTSNSPGTDLGNGNGFQADVVDSAIDLRPT